MNDITFALLGGVLIGVGSVIAMAASGKIPGISGIVARAMSPNSNDRFWRLLFIVGLMIGGVLVHIAGIGWHRYLVPEGRNIPVYIVAGLLVGFGTRVGGGCTSGHGVCGIGSGAKDGLVYTIVFMAAGIVTVTLWSSFVNGGVGQ